MHPQRIGIRIASSTRVLALLLLLVYLGAGSVFTAMAFLATDVEQWGCLFYEQPLTLGQKSTLSLDLMFSFVVRRFLASMLVSVALAWSIRRSRSRKVIAGIAVGIPVLAEISFALPGNHTWLGILYSYVYTWPDVPQHLMNIGPYVRVGIAYMAPPFLAGLVLAVVAIRLRGRFLPGSS